MEKGSGGRDEDAITEVDDAETDNGDATSDITGLESEVALYRGGPEGGGAISSGESASGSYVGSAAGNSAPEELADAISVASEWTMSTYDESMVNHGQRISNTWVTSSDNFDRDRHVSLSKDMLQSMWSGPNAAQPPSTSNSRHQTRGDFSSWRTEQGEKPAFVDEIQLVCVTSL